MKRAIRVGGWIMVVFAAFAAAGQTRLGVPAYQDPGSAQWTAWAAPGAKAIGIMIVNLDNGDDEAYYPSVDKAIRATRKRGIFVIGYTYTGYGTRDPKIVRRKIDAVYRNYLVDGIFFDEAPTDCGASNPFFSSQFLYYEELTNYVREKTGARITVLNPGTNSASDCWMGITNILMNWEGKDFPNYRDNYVDYAWVHKYPPDRFWHIVYGMGANQLQKALDLAKQRNAGWVYLTEEAGNPYAQPPKYWTAEAEAVEQQAVQAVFASAWPDSYDGQGERSPGRTSIRWSGASTVNWQIFLDTDQNAKTGYTGGGIAVGSEYLFDTEGGTAHLWRYVGTGADWNWTEVSANAALDVLDPNVQAAGFDTVGLGVTKAFKFQIRALDASGHPVYDSYVFPLSLNNTGLVFDVVNHS
ncbi:MAG: spherulation-specific family 4 protein [Terriglobales bacterium]